MPLAGYTGVRWWISQSPRCTSLHTHALASQVSILLHVLRARLSPRSIGCLDNVADDEDDDVPRLSAFYLMFRVPLQFPLGDDPWIRLVSRYAYCISFNARELIRRRHAREVPGRRLPRAVSAFVRSPRLKASQGIRALEAVIFECTLSGPRNVHARSLRPYLRANKTYRRRGITSHVKAVLLKSVLIQWDADGLFVKYAEPFQVRRDRSRGNRILSRGGRSGPLSLTRSWKPQKPVLYFNDAKIRFHDRRNGYHEPGGAYSEYLCEQQLYLTNKGYSWLVARLDLRSYTILRR